VSTGGELERVGGGGVENGAVPKKVSARGTLPCGLYLAFSLSLRSGGGESWKDLDYPVALSKKGQT